MKKLVALLLVLTMAVALFGCGAKQESAGTQAPAAAPEAPAVDDTVYELNFYHIFSSTGHEQEWIEKIVAEVDAQSGGHVKVNVVADGTMGGEDELIPQVVAGTLDMSLSGPSVWGTNAGLDEIGWSELPYVVTGYDEENALGEVLPDLINKQLADAGVSSLYCLGAMSQGVRSLICMKPVHQMSDVVGMKLRVPSSDVYQSTVQAWGASPTAMSSSEVISALSNGTIDGLESDPSSIIARGQHEIIKYFVETNHIASLNLLMISTASLQKLPTEYQELVKTIFKDMCVQQCYDRKDACAEDIVKMQEAGVEVITLTPEALQEFIDADTTYQQEWIKQYGVEDIVAEAQAYVADKVG